MTEAAGLLWAIKTIQSIGFGKVVFEVNAGGCDLRPQPPGVLPSLKGFSSTSNSYMQI